MNEPSVLDYLKYKLGMIDSLELPDEKEPQPKDELPSKKVSPPHQLAAASQPIAEVSPESEEDSSFSIHPSTFPWRSLLALLLALMGQRAFEPPHQDTPLSGLVFYAAALVALFLAWRRAEWRLPAPRKSLNQPDSFDLSLPKILGLVLALLLSIGAFFTFAGNRFTLYNTLPWLLALFLFGWGFWRKGEQKEAHSFNLKWGLSLLAVTAIILFFRLYQTSAVPAEPFSDHAEKILDVYDITQGETHIFFPRNTGREALQMYWTLLVAKIFGTGLSFISLKLGTALLGLLTLPYVYLLGKEVASKRVGLIALFLMGISYWHNVISRVGLRFPLYPLFVAPTLFYLLRGIRRQSRNDFILAGLFLGLGSHGYSPFRIMPFVVAVAVLLYLLHKQSRWARKQIGVYFAMLAFFSIIVFLPLGRYALENPIGFSARAFSRLGYFSGESLKIFADNFWDGLKMLNYDNGGIWVHSVAGRPALGVVSGAFFLMGVFLLIWRYFRERDWRDLYLLAAIPLLQLPSTLSIAFPDENPALNRAGGAAVVVFLVAALAVDGLIASLKSRAARGWQAIPAWGLIALLAAFSLYQNYDLVFNQYAESFRLSSWNSSEMGQVIKEFEEAHGQTDTVWIVPYQNWVDTRLPGVWAGIPNRNFGIWTDDLHQTLEVEGPKLFMYKVGDEEALDELRSLYPNGSLTRYVSKTPNHDFMVYRVP